MTRDELIKKIAEDAEITKKAATNALNSVLEGITEALQANSSITFVGFGTFKVTERKARKGVNPRSGEQIDIPARNVPTFKAGSKLKEAVKTAK
ncbi:MAG: HU family DNA-binding protein [Candidatus Cloacimonadales bacterium]|jgi:DNA-binding protein HU-beta|nr:HU family DNA-binding protein [Candidatus Cloacimonadota bacterium]MDD2650948.1 HU family DNA-binding protein [Candidatus Cloacimonadota bacterium]MDD3502192.1 HU family DNA-binding protein [Candidatus Cloacimonadota bacterium]MDX9976416.1 HU family DNA-binding protein [Candidatus Cloacimonadales bacterium]